MQTATSFRRNLPLDADRAVVTDAGHRGPVEVDRWLMIKDLNCLRVRVPPTRTSTTTRGREGCAEAVRLAWCDHCGFQFAVCRSCDRGQTHCGQLCAGRRRGIQLREIRKRYRHSLAGREAHRDEERRRRQRKREALAGSAPTESVGDHRSQTAARRATVAPQTLVPTVPASSISEGASKPVAGLLKCHRCSRSGIFIAPRGWRDRLRPCERMRM